MKLQEKSIKNIDATNIASQKEAREFIKITERTVRVEFDKIVIRKGFNLREDFGDLEELASSIEQTGLQESITVDILKDGSAILTDGERRYRAIALLRQKDETLKKKFDWIDAKTNDRSFTDCDRIVAMMVHNSGKPFEPVEEAEGFRRLHVEHGLSLTQIAAKIGKRVPYVEQRLLLSNADAEEKNNVRSGKISATAQQELMRTQKDPVKRKQIVKAAAAKGKKVKVKDVKKAPIEKKIDKVLAIVKQADKAAKDGTMRNLLFEIDAELRQIKKDYQ